MTDASAAPLPPFGWIPILARGLLVLVGVAPFLPPLLHGIPVLGSVADVFEAWFVFQCHREPERSFALFGATMPVCFRCFGIYQGLGLGALTLWPRLQPVHLRVWVGVAAFLMILDVWTESVGLRPPFGPLRTLTGLLLAYPVGGALVWTARDAVSPAES